MALEAHIQELERRHEVLGKEIEDAVAHPSASDLEIADMKRRKLQLKDEIEKLRAS
ncbi:MAG: DUF465 domain-containing protein [Cohaesibacter sp.]|jgi:hypothetical protein|nr:DUF465 domain-containing protein [Cohaesibacter sp.]